MPEAIDRLAVVFDLGNVLIRWDPLPAVSAGVGAERAAAMLSAGDFDFAAWNHEQDAGRPWQEAEDVVAQSFPQWSDAIRAYRANFDVSMLGPIDGSVAILRELHAAGVPLFALTNWSADLFPLALQRFDFLGLFADIVVSGVERIAKPDPRIFEVLRARIGPAYPHAVFIDDAPRNVVGATRSGFDALLFTGSERLRVDLRERGLPLGAHLD